MLNHLELYFLTHPKDLSVLAPDPKVMELIVIEVGRRGSLDPRGIMIVPLHCLALWPKGLGTFAVLLDLIWKICRYPDRAELYHE